MSKFHGLGHSAGLMAGRVLIRANEHVALSEGAHCCCHAPHIISERIDYCSNVLGLHGQHYSRWKQSARKGRHDKHGTAAHTRGGHLT